MTSTGDRMDLIETFICIADEGGIGAAARVLGASQPTVSRRLQQLETSLGAKLVDRGSHGMNLTSAGAELLPEAREIIARWQGLSSVVADHTQEVSGLVRFAATPSLAEGALPGLLAMFLAEFPDVRVEAIFTDSIHDLAVEGLDFALCAGAPRQEGLATKEITRERWILVGAPVLAEHLGRTLGVPLDRCEPSALDGAPFVGPAGCDASPIEFMGRAGETVEAQFACVAASDGVSPRRRVVASGAGFALLPAWLARPDIERGVFTQIARDWVADEEPISLLWSPSRFRAPAASALMERLREELPESMIEF